MTLISVIVPNYNHARFLNRRLDSIFNQTFQDFEVIILDDASTDNSKEIIERYRNHPKVKTIIYNDYNTGSPFKQWAKGIGIAETEWIWIAESDDYCKYEFLNEVSPAFLKKDCVLAFAEVIWVNDKSEITKIPLEMSQGG